MKERPILFNGAMVRAILDGRKTQTRRVVKGVALHWLEQVAFDAVYVALPSNGLSPYGFDGDRLWVRESFWGCDSPETGDTPCVVYDDEWHGKEYRPAEIRPWAPRFGHIPSIHMPRECSRITLEVTGVHIERLQETSNADAQAEGAYLLECEGGGWKFARGEQEHDTPREAFFALWEQLNGAASVAANPWVWVVEFKLETEES